MKSIRVLLKKHNFYISVGTVTLLLVILVGRILIPFSTQLFETFRVLDEKRANLGKLTQKRIALEGIDDSMFKLLSEAEIALPQEKDAASILTSLENLSTLTSFAVGRVGLTPGLVSTQSAQAPATDTPAVPAAQTGDPSLRKGAKTLSIDTEGSGTTAQFLEFVKRIQTGRRVFDIESIQVGVSVENTDQVSAKFTLLAYYLPPPATIGSIESILPPITEEEQQVLQSLSGLADTSTALLNQPFQQGTAIVGKTNLFIR